MGPQLQQKTQSMQSFPSEKAAPLLMAAIYGIVVIYCLVILVMMFLPSVKAAFAGTAAVAAEPPDYHDRPTEQME
jgi:hypothetical protein